MKIFGQNLISVNEKKQSGWGDFLLRYNKKQYYHCAIQLWI